MSCSIYYDLIFTFFQAYKQGLGYPNEMFIIPYWFGLEWIRENTTCSENQLLTVLDNTLAVNLEPPATQIIDEVNL